MKKRGYKRRYVVALFESSKSQVSIFTLLSILILLIGVLYFYYQKESTEQEIDVVQPEIAPVKLYVEDCIKKITQDGLETIGLTGGYIKVPDKVKVNPRAYLTDFPVAGLKVPYWWYDSINSIPLEEFVRQELINHVQNELKACVDDFKPFAKRFQINKLKEPVVDAQFNENDVSVSLKYMLEIVSKGGNFKATIENFRYTMPIRFKKVYELAKLIMERENKDYFIERRTIDIYSINKGIPTTEVKVSCNRKTWKVSEIRDDLKKLLRVNLPYIRIKGTDYNENIYVPNPESTNNPEEKNTYAGTYFQKNYVWEIDTEVDTNPKKYKNMKVAFTYDNWPLYIYARPSENGVLSSNSQKGTDALSFLCLQISHFTYDVNYPVMVTIFDKETPTNNEYNFRFAFRINVDHNYPNRVSTGITGTKLFEREPDLTSEEFCSTVQNEINIFTLSNGTPSEDLRGVNLTFVCGRYYCDVGQSDWIGFGASAGIKKRLPYCVYGIIKGTKNGFADSKSFIQTDVDGRSYILVLNPIKEFKNYKVVKHSLSNPQVVQELDSNDRASISIKGIDTGFESFSFYPRETNEKEEINFPINIPKKDSIYEVSIYLSDDKNINGGYIGNWSLSQSELENSNQIIFHVVEHESESEDERFLFISGLSSYSKNIPSPELK